MENELFEKAPIHQAYFKMALPVVFSMVVSLIYNMADTFFIAKTQNTALVAGVSLCSPIFILMIALGDIFGLGGSSVISRMFGEKRNEEGRRVSGFCFWTAILGGILVACLMLLFKAPILNLLGADGQTAVYASQYFFYLALGAPILIVNYTPSNMLRTEGLAMESMIGTMFGTVINIILDPIFIFGLNMGAGGAAIATVLGTLCSDILLIFFVLKKSRRLTVSFRGIKINGSVFSSILAIGIPASITNLMQSFGIMITNRHLEAYGTEHIAAMGIAMKVNMIVMLVMVGFSFGAQPIIGYNYGAKNMKRMRNTIRFALVFEISLALVMSLVLTILSPNILRAFMEDKTIVSSGSMMLRCMLSTTAFATVILIFTVVFQAAGKALSALTLSISRQGIILAISMFTLSRLFGYYGVIWAQPLSDLMTAVIALGLYLRLRRRELV